MSGKSIPTEAVTIYNNALELSNKKSFSSAIEEYKKAIGIYPAFMEAYNNIGEINSQLGRSEDALSAYNEALKIERNHRVLLNLGVEYYNRMEFDDALKFFLESVKKDKSYLEGNLYTALAYYSLRDLKAAEKYFLEVINSDKRHIRANYLLSTIYYEWKEYEKALIYLENIKDLYKDKLFINRYYGFCCYYTGRYDEAVKYLTTALESQPGYKKFKKYLKSLTYEKKIKEIKNIDKEIKELEKKIDEEITGINEVTKLSMLYIFKGKNSKAEKILLKAKEKAKERLAS